MPAPAAPSARIGETGPDRAAFGSKWPAFALTTNPLNLFIGRYGINFEYQPLPHHTLIVSPHYDYLSGDPGQEGSCNGLCHHELSGVGTEIGYRFYTGSHGLYGFFIGPSLIVSQHTSRFTNPQWLPPYNDYRTPYTEIGGAIDVGGQWQEGHFIFGAGAGIQLTALSKQVGFTGRGIDVFGELNAGGGLRPRLLLSLGYAF